MRVSRRLIAAAMLALWSGAAPAAPMPALDRAIEAAPGFSGVVLVGDRTGLVYRRSGGDAAPARAQKPGDVWRWASVTKQVTALLVMQEVERGRLVLDVPLGSYLPDFPNIAARGVTIRQLLQHSSGLPNPDDTLAPARGFPAFYGRTGAGVGNRAAAFGYCAGPAKGKPGEGFAYNNCDYLVLGAILERQTGKSFASLVQDRIARPLGLRSLGVAGRTTVTATVDGAPEPRFNLATFGAAGALTGTPEDLLALDRALLDGRLLGKDATAAMWAGDPKLGYEALGAWSFPAKLKGCAAPVALVERRGEIGGVEVRNILAPALDKAVVVFVNASPIDFGEIWQGKGLSFDLLSAALCGGES